MTLLRKVLESDLTMEELKAREIKRLTAMRKNLVREQRVQLAMIGFFFCTVAWHLISLVFELSLHRPSIIVMRLAMGTLMAWFMLRYSKTYDALRYQITNIDERLVQLNAQVH